MLGSIAGDIIGSVHEGAGTKFKDFDLLGSHSSFTDDTVLRVAVADVLHKYFHRYQWAGYGGSFISWASQQRRDPYNSWGSDSAMRVKDV